MAVYFYLFLVIFFQTEISYSAACPKPRLARNLMQIDVCEKQTTCFGASEIMLLKEQNKFPLYGMPVQTAKTCDGNNRNGPQSSILFARESATALSHGPTELAVQMKDNIRNQVQQQLEKSSKRISFVASCVEAYEKSEIRKPNGDLDEVETSKIFNAYDAKTTSTACASLWDRSVARKPIAYVLTQELLQMRSLMALGQSWSSPEKKELQHFHPTLNEDFYQHLAKKLEPLSPAELKTLEATKNQLIQDCMVERKGNCFDEKIIQAYAKERYLQHVNENPILMYFSLASQPGQAMPAYSVSLAYRTHQKKMQQLNQVKLNDQDYFLFKSYLEKEIASKPDSERGNMCEVASEIYANFSAKENLHTSITVIAALYGGVGGLLGKGIIGRIIGAATKFSAVYSPNSLVQALNYSHVQDKLVATCSQSHLGAKNVCDIDGIRGNSESKYQEFVSAAMLGPMGLYGVGARLVR